MKLRVLIVDDTKTVRFQTKLLLHEGNYEIDEAVDGVEALKKIATFKPHIVLMDVNMPNMNGIECCRNIKRDPSLQGTKVIMVTTATDYPVIDAAFKAGCDDYVSKPINKLELLSKTQDLSNLVRSSAFLAGIVQREHRFH